MPREIWRLGVGSGREGEAVTSPEPGHLLTRNDTGPSPRKPQPPNPRREALPHGIRPPPSSHLPDRCVAPELHLPGWNPLEAGVTRDEGRLQGRKRMYAKISRLEAP